MSAAYHVRISGDQLVFSASHFITFDGDVCEQLHGHNYRVAAEVHGPLDENHYVVDFLALREVLGEILAELDHRVLLPTEHARIQMEVRGEEIEARFPPRRWVFPRAGCALLPVANTTAELLARHIAGRLARQLDTRCGARPELVSIRVDESFGQSAVCRLRCR